MSAGSVRPLRDVIQADAIAWMDANRADARASVITSLPDISELALPTLEAYRAWFVAAVVRIVRWVPTSGFSIFYQSDVRHGGAWIDKGYLVVRGAEEAGASLAWHKIVFRKPPGTVALGRPSYAHMIAVTRAPLRPPRRPGPDILPAGPMPWSKAMGVDACRVACGFLREESETRVVVDPFCGRGTVLAVANALGFDAVGVDIGRKRCRAARRLVLDDV